MTTSRKYTDTDVRRNLDMLKGLAVRYIEQYHGEFEPILKAAYHLRHEGDLPVSLVRIILNCMRCDPEVVNLPAPGEYTFDATLDMAKQSVPRVTKYRPRYIDLPTQFKLGYAVHLGRGASKIHYVWNEESKFRYYPAIGEFQCRIRWHCRPCWMIKEHNFRLLTVLQAADLLAFGYRFCGQCQTAQQTRSQRSQVDGEGIPTGQDSP